MMNIRSHGFDCAQYDIWWNMLIKFSKQIANTFAKILKANSKPCQTSEMELFLQVVTGFRDKFRFMPNM